MKSFDNDLEMVVDSRWVIENSAGNIDCYFVAVEDIGMADNVVGIVVKVVVCSFYCMVVGLIVLGYYLVYYY